MDPDDVLETLERIDYSNSHDKALLFEDEAASLAHGENGRATFLCSAAAHWHMQGDPDRAHLCYQRALEDGGDTFIHPLAGLLDLALERGDEGAASSFADRLRDLVKSDELNNSTCHFVGESFEVKDRLREAARWFTFPLSWVDPEDEDLLDYLCLFGRLRVRERQGLPADRFDLVAKRWIAERAAAKGRA